jgi:hypothetical protein
MSDADQMSHEPADHEAGINVRMVVVVGAASLVAFVICTVVAALIMNRMDADYAAAGGPPPDPRAVKERHDEIGIVEQIPFDADRRLELWQARMAKRLAGYGWVDRGKGIIHIPIERAMEEVVQKAGGAAK